VSLLVKTSGQGVVSHGRQQAVSAPPQGHFLLLPSDNSLLLKSIAVSEMMLPSDVQSPVEGTSDSALSVVASCLDQVSTTKFVRSSGYSPDTRNNSWTNSFFFHRSNSPIHTIHFWFIQIYISVWSLNPWRAIQLQSRWKGAFKHLRLVNPNTIQLFAMIPL